MCIRYLSLIETPPAGFVVIDDTRDLLSGVVALLAESRESALALLPDFAARVRGVVITYGAEAMERIGPLLWRISVPRESPVHAGGLLAIALEAVATANAFQEGDTPAARTAKHITAETHRRDLDDKAACYLMELLADDGALSTMLDGIDSSIFVKDTQGRHLYVNRAARELLRAELEDIVGFNHDKFFDADTAKAIRNFDRQVLDSGITLHTEEVVATAARGFGAVFQVTRFPLRRKDGSICGLFGIATENSAQRESERLFRTLAENTPDAVVRYDRHCRRIYVNPAFERINGVSSHEVINKTLLESPTRLGAHARLFTDRLVAALDSGQPDKFEVTLHDLAGTRRILVRIIPEFDNDHNVISALGIFSDISELMEKERQLEESLDTVRHLTARRDRAREEERQRIAREIHDELGQALTAQRLEIATLKYQFGKDNEALAAQCDRMTEIADRTIQTVRHLATHLRPTALEMGIVTALEWLANGFQSSMTLPCRLHIQPPDLELDDAQSIAVFRIVQESLTNIMRHARAHQVDIHVEACEDSCRLSICDDGIGFDIHHAGQDSFGLVGIRERAQMVSGEARIISASGQGTTVEVVIPRRRKRLRTKRSAP